MNPYDHALSSVRHYGGRAEDYVPTHNWLDASKATLAHFTHRALRHHRQGVAEAAHLFGDHLTNSDGDQIAVSSLGLQHIAEDCSIIPDAADWLHHLEAPAGLFPDAAPNLEVLAAQSARRFGGSAEDFLPLHTWFLATTAWFEDARHLAMRHHAFGIFEAEARFGVALSTSAGAVPTRIVAEAHVRAVLGRIPAATDFLRRIKGQPWMAAAQSPRRLGLR